MNPTDGRVKVNGKTGYVSAQYLKSNSGNSGGGNTEKVIATKYVSVNPLSLNLRNGPSTNATIIGKLGNGTKWILESTDGRKSKSTKNGIRQQRLPENTIIAGHGNQVRQRQSRLQLNLRKDRRPQPKSLARGTMVTVIPKRTAGRK